MQFIKSWHVAEDDSDKMAGSDSDLVAAASGEAEEVEDPRHVMCLR